MHQRMHASIPEGGKPQYRTVTYCLDSGFPRTIHCGPKSDGIGIHDERRRARSDYSGGLDQVGGTFVVRKNVGGPAQQ
jgi:hypothetical protein